MNDKPLRVNLGLRGQTAELVNTLAGQGYRPKDVIYDALTLLDFAIQELAQQKKFGSFDLETQTMNSVVTPILREVARNPEWLREYLGQYAENDQEAGSA